MFFRRLFSKLGFGDKPKDHSPAVFRRDWGNDANGTITKLEVALDAITPGDEDCSVRTIYRETVGFGVSIAFYSDIYFAGPIKETYNIMLSQEVVDELIAKKYVIPFSLFDNPAPRM